MLPLRRAMHEVRDAADQETQKMGYGSVSCTSELLVVFAKWP